MNRLPEPTSAPATGTTAPPRSDARDPRSGPSRVRDLEGTLAGAALPARRALLLHRVLAEHPAEDDVDVLEVIAQVEELGELGVRQGHLGVGLQEVEEIAFAAPDLHGVALDRRIAGLAAQPLLGQ